MFSQRIFSNGLEFESKSDSIEKSSDPSITLPSELADNLQILSPSPGYYHTNHGVP